MDSRINWQMPVEFIVRLTIGTVVAALSDLLLVPLWTATINTYSFNTWLAFLLVAALGGAVFGYIQWQIALKDMIDRLPWVIATAVVISLLYFMVSVGQNYIPPIGATVSNGCLSASCNSYILLPTWPVGIFIVSFVSSVSIGVPIWFVLRRYSYRASWWIVASVIISASTSFSFLVLATAIKDSLAFAFCFYICLVPIIYCLIAGIFLHLIFKSPSQKSLARHTS